MTVIALISPHPDDACFSVALHTLSWVGLGHPVRIVTCFSESDYAPNITESHRDVSAIRAAEDEAFVEHLRVAGPRVERLSLGLLDAPLRLGVPIERVCDGNLVPQDDPEEVARLTGVFGRVLQDAAIVAPLGLGGHIDHLVVREAVIRASGNRPIAFYEDLPYAYTIPDAEIVAHALKIATRLGRRLEPQVSTWNRSLPTKLGLSRLYASQILDEDAQAIAGLHARYAGGERIWQDVGFRRVLWRKRF